MGLPARRPRQGLRMHMTRLVAFALAAIGAPILLAACVDLAPPWAGQQDAEVEHSQAGSDAARDSKDGTGRVGPDAASGGSGGDLGMVGGTTAGRIVAGGAGELASSGGTGGSLLTGKTGGLPATGGTGGSPAAGGASGLPAKGGAGGLPAAGGVGGLSAAGGSGSAGTGGTSGTQATGAGGSVAVDAGSEADARPSPDTGLPLAGGASGFGGAGTGGIGGSGMGGAAAGGRSGTGGSGVGGSGTGGSGAGGSGTGGSGVGGSGAGGSGTGGATSSMIISVDFVGGGLAGNTGTVVMAASESAGVKPATHWNSAASRAGTLSSLVLADGTLSSASITWNSPLPSGATSATWSLYLTDAPGDVRMMNGYLDPTATTSPATIDVTGLAAPMSSGYDVYVYCRGDISMADTRTFRYTIGSTTHTVTETGPTVHTYVGHTLAPEQGTGDYVVFRNVTGTSFTLTAQPGTSTAEMPRAPVNGIQIVYPAGS